MKKFIQNKKGMDGWGLVSVISMLLLLTGAVLFYILFRVPDFVEAPDVVSDIEDAKAQQYLTTFLKTPVAEQNNLPVSALIIQGNIQPIKEVFTKTAETSDTYGILRVEREIIGDHFKFSCTIKQNYVTAKLPHPEGDITITFQPYTCT